MAPETKTLLSELRDGLVKFNAVLKTVEDNGGMKLIAATIPGAAQIIADVELGSDALSLMLALAPLIEEAAALLESRGVRFPRLSIRPASPEFLDSIDQQKDAL